MLKTRPATLADEDRFMELFTQLMASAPEREDILRPAFRRLLDEPTRGAVLLVEDETVILGLITFSYNFAIRYSGFYAQIEELVVDEAARGKHAGAALVQASITASRAHGCKEIGLYAVPHNQPFYEKQGFAYSGPELRQPL
jgi:GNAT superfamily N-acetyltransferase